MSEKQPETHQNIIIHKLTSVILIRLSRPNQIRVKAPFQACDLNPIFVIR